MKSLILFLILIPYSVKALEVDEKLTVRIVKSSETRKTIMVNRGIEDGLVEGDHAKFIVTAGIVARAVCVKVSPTRSVWSIYRLVNADFIVPDSVMTLKISPAVKITKDESQALVQDDVPTKVTTEGAEPAALGIPLADGAQDLSSADALSQEDMKALDENEGSGSILQRNIEFIGMLSISGLTSNTKTEDGDQSFNNSQSTHHIGLGAELYAPLERTWYSRFSLVGFVNLIRENSQSYSGAGVQNDLTELEVGTNWHPFKLPGTANEFIPYFHFGFNIGSVKSTFKPGIENPGGNEFSANGSTSGWSAGFGYKYYTMKGFGFRALFDYYYRSERFKEDDSTFVFNKTVAGPRLMLGISYRF
jgi:hypothetical protein